MRLSTPILLFASLLLALPFYQAVGEEWVTVKSWSGSGRMNTEEFDIQTSSFKIIWKVLDLGITGTDLFSIEVYKNGSYEGLAANSIVDTVGYQQESYMHSGKGIYYIEIGGPDEWEVIVQEPRTSTPQSQPSSIAEKISLSNFKVVDAVGTRLTDVSTGQQVVLQSSVKNNVGLDQKFAYIMNIKDSDGITITIAWINGEIPSDKTFDIGLSWIPDAKGKYDVSVFMWQSIANPLPLSSKTLSTTISVI